MDYNQALAFLDRFTNYERELRYPYDGWAMNLERVRGLLEPLGHPDRRLRIVHIAGSKGKGSVAAMIESMARAAGLKTGLYTSPHLLDFKERIRIAGRTVSEPEVAKAVERLAPAVEEVHARADLGQVTYFEILTATAFFAFAAAGVELAIMETGLGGRWDATNVCRPLISVLTPVSLDHTDILGATLDAIAHEKKMIIKPGAPALIAPQSPEVYAVFSGRCHEVGAPEIRVADRWQWKVIEESVEGQTVSFAGDRNLERVRISLVGDRQAMNAATAIAALHALSGQGIEIGDEAIREGLASLSWPGRFQRVRTNPDLILDGAHNADSAAFLARTVKRLYPGRRVIAVVGLGGDKDVEGFCRELAPALHAAVITRSKAMKAVDTARLRRALAAFGLELFEEPDTGAALEHALRLAAPPDLVLVTGSFYVISDAMKWLTEKNATP